MSLLITVDKLYFMDGIYRVTAQTEKPVEGRAYISQLTLTEIKPIRAGLNHTRLRSLKYNACLVIAKEYNLVTSEQLTYGEIEAVTDSLETLSYNTTPTYPDYREAIEGVEGVYLTD